MHLAPSIEFPVLILDNLIDIEPSSVLFLSSLTYICLIFEMPIWALDKAIERLQKNWCCLRLLHHWYGPTLPLMLLLSMESMSERQTSKTWKNQLQPTLHNFGNKPSSVICITIYHGPPLVCHHGTRESKSRSPNRTTPFWNHRPTWDIWDLVPH